MVDKKCVAAVVETQTKTRFWNFFTQMKMDEYYYARYQDSSAKWERNLTIATCIVSFGGIALWPIWETLWWLWAIIIAAAQILSAIKHLLPFSRRAIVGAYFLQDFGYLINEVEYAYGRILTGQLKDDDEINDIEMGLKKRKSVLLSKYAINEAFLMLITRRFEKAAEAKKDDYFRQRYGIEPLKKNEEVYP